MTFRVGQKVVLVNDQVDDGCIFGIRSGVWEKGNIYTVRDFVSSHRGDEVPYIRLIEIVRDIDEHGFRISRFRPLIERKTSISVFTAMLNPSKKEVDA